MILDLQKTLNAFSKKHNLIEKATRSCEKSIQVCFKEDKEIGILTLNGIPEENIRLKFNSQFLISKREHSDTPCFKTKFDIYNNAGKSEVYEEMEYVGFYELDVDENGVIFDDWLVFI